MEKYLDRTCTPDERDELLKYIKASSGPDTLDMMGAKAWIESRNHEIPDELTWHELKETRAESKKPALHVAWSRVWKWSAVAAVLLGVYFATTWSEDQNDIVSYETGYGEQLEVLLDDGTKVYLNADSKLTWDEDWVQNGMRIVQLEGEAFFDVSHIDVGDSVRTSPARSHATTSSRMPFEVLTSDLKIRVLGTAFSTTRRRGKTEVFLESGKVELSLRSRDKQQAHTKKNDVDRTSKVTGSNNKTAADGDQVIHMEPGDWVSYSASEDVLVQKVFDQKEKKSEWKKGVLSFRDVEFRVMLESLEDLYGKSFEVVDKSLLAKRVNFGVPFKDWDTVKEMMEWMLRIEIVSLDDTQIRIKKQKGN